MEEEPNYKNIGDESDFNQFLNQLSHHKNVPDGPAMSLSKFQFYSRCTNKIFHFLLN